MNARERLRALAAWAGSAGVRIKFMGIALGLILLAGTGAAWQVRQATTTMLASELEERAGSIARGVARRAADLIVTEDPVALRELLHDALEENKDVRYLLVLNQHGNVLAHTFGHFLPPDLQPMNQGPWRGRARVLKLASEEGNLLDVAVPIFEGEAGTVRVGMAEARMAQTIDRTTLRVLQLAGAVCILAVFAAYLPTAVLTRPVIELRDLAARVGREDFTVRARVRFRDEIGQLAEAFNDMVARLERAGSERSRLGDALRANEEARRKLVEKVISAQEEERRRLARELHDEAGQSLASLLLGLGMLETASGLGEAREKAAELRGVAQRVLGDLRQIAWSLRPSLLDRLGLAAALPRLAEEYGAGAGIAVSCHLDGLGDSRLRAGVETTVYRIVQEALTNVVRHAGTDGAQVALRQEGASLVGEIRDAGKGFDVDATLQSAPAGKRLGLFGMQERANLVGGRLWVESVPGAGTKVAFAIPLEEE